MSNYVESAAELVGKTPLLKLNGYSKKAGVTEANIFGKLEYLNPAGSVKDRIALAMIKDAEDKGLLKPGATIIEPTSGNTGIGIASVAAAKGYRAILTLPDTIVKVGDMSFIGMDNLQAVISKAQGINIVVRDNVKIVTDRSQLDSNDINNDDNNNNNNSNSNSSNNTNGGNTQGNDNGDSSSSGNGDSGSSSVGSGGAIIDSDNNVIIDSSNGTVIEENIDKNVGDSSATISSFDNKKDNNKSTQVADSKNETASKTTKKSSAPKIIAYIVCVIVIIGLAAGAIIFIKKKRR